MYHWITTRRPDGPDPVMRFVRSIHIVKCEGVQLVFRCERTPALPLKYCYGVTLLIFIASLESSGGVN